MKSRVHHISRHDYDSLLAKHNIVLHIKKDRRFHWFLWLERIHCGSSILTQWVPPLYFASLLFKRSCISEPAPTFQTVAAGCCCCCSCFATHPLKISITWPMVGRNLCPPAEQPNAPTIRPEPHVYFHRVSVNLVFEMVARRVTLRKTGPRQRMPAH